ncbi:MAG: ATP-binding protein [Spirochaetes bacterium]|nr:ATP-binding protein [Spirochaetota bacterium]
MEQHVMYIGDYEILTLGKALKEAARETETTLKADSDGTGTFITGRILVPSSMRLSARFSDGTEAGLAVEESSDREFKFYDKKYRLTFSNGNTTNGHVPKLARAIKSALARTIPNEFLSLEHLFNFLESPSEMKITSLNDTLLLPGDRALKMLFNGWKVLGVVESKSDISRLSEKLRLEVREEEYRYVDINRFTVYRKEEIVVAAGMCKVTAQMSNIVRYIPTVFARKTDSAVIEKLFGKHYEELLLENQDLKGGKFTGDYKIIKLAAKLTMDDIVLEEGVRDKIMNEIFNFFSYKPMYKKAGLPFKRGVALYGPPGTGKTMIAKIIASVMKETVIWVKAGDLGSTEDINRIFRLARMGAPSVVILEDVDFYTEDRASTSANKPGIATLMANLDGLEENEGILVIVTTNRLECVEKAIIDRPGRIDSRVFMGELGRASIALLLEKKLSSFDRDFTTFLDVIPEHTVMTGSAVVELSSAILRNALKNASGPDSDIVITRDMVKAAIRDMQRRENRVAGFAAASK